MIELIYCAAGNKRFGEIAIEIGWTYGAQIVKKFYHKVEFSDVDPNNPPPREQYMAKLAEHKPRMATVLDWEREDDFETVMSWAEEASQFVETVIVIPKVPNLTYRIPNRIKDVPIRLGYSVPSGHAQTTVSPAEFGTREVHLLGGGPIAQWRLAHKYNWKVLSLDGNYAQKMAVRHNQFFVVDGSATHAQNKHWPSLSEADGQRWGDGSSTADAPYEAFRRSMNAIWDMWRGNPQKRYFPTTMSFLE